MLKVSYYFECDCCGSKDKPLESSYHPHPGVGYHLPTSGYIVGSMNVCMSCYHRCLDTLNVITVEVKDPGV